MVRTARSTLGWLRRHLNLVRAWYLYFVLLAAFLTSALLYPNPSVFQVGSVVFSIMALYLIMVTSNRELQRSTKLQADLLATELSNVDGQLRSVVSHLQKVVSVMEGLREAMVQQSGMQEEIFEEEKRERVKHVERIKPKLSASLNLTGGSFWIFDWRHHALVVKNSGGDCQDLTIATQDGRVQEPRRLNHNNQTSYDFGPISFTINTIFPLGITCMDLDFRQYSGSVSSISNQSTWYPIIITATE